MARQEKKYHYIYKTTCLITGKYYIGMHSTDNLNDGYMGSGKRLRFSINYHGKDNHIKEILEFCFDKISLAEKEIKYINNNKTYLCMNLAAGGFGGATRLGMKHTEETKEKIRKKLIGHIVSEETKEKISKNGKNIKKPPLSFQTKEKISNAKKGKSSKLKGISRTIETKEKISKANRNNEKLKLKRKPLSFQTKEKISNANKEKNNIAVIQYEKNGDLVKIWDKITDAEETLNISHISSVCKGKRKTSGGYVWKYA